MIFVLGIERSATTWMATILDHHPRTDVIMEPLSGYISHFDDWPHRFEPIGNLKERADYFYRELEELNRNRRFIFTRLADSPIAWRNDLSTAEWLVQKDLASKELRNFLEMNYHRKDRRISLHKEPPLQTVIKELRLNFNAAFVKALDSEVRVVVTIREMASCVRSIIQQIDKGNLIELRQALTERYGEVSVKAAAQYWKESYESLIETLQEADIQHQVIPHVDMLESPENTVKNMLAFLELDYTDSIQKFLDYSDQSGSGKHNTRRDRSKLLEEMQRDREEIYPQVESVVQEIEAHPILKKYITRS